MIDRNQRATFRGDRAIATPKPPAGEVAAARIRAARGFAGLTQPALADKLGVSLATMKRIESGARPLSTDELLAIAEATGVPASFMLRGFAVDENNIADRLAEIERRYRIHERDMAEIKEAYRRLATGDA